MPDLVAPDILIIEYESLGSSIHGRLQMLGLLGRLLPLEVGLYSRYNLQITASDWAQILDWVSNHDVHHYRVEGGYLRVFRSCAKHMVIGTGQLMRDLANTHTLVAKEQLSAEDIWRIARQVALESMT